jgi:Protein of unknown function (DUF1353)
MSADTEVSSDAGNDGAAGSEDAGAAGPAGAEVAEAVRRVWRWRKDTAPFASPEPPDGPAAFVVEQVGDSEFCIPVGAGFRYVPADGGLVVDVNAETLPSTDFASIPRYMSWFVSRHGRHTPAALVHDRLVTDEMSLEERVRADAVFLAMLDDLAVPPVQSRVMWAAVTAATRMSCSARSRAGIIAWGVAAAVGTGLLAWGVATGTPAAVVGALLLPVPAALLWGRQRAAGLIAGYAVPVVAVPAAASLAGYWCYWLVETAVKLVRRLFAHNRDEPLPDPIPYQGR